MVKTLEDWRLLRREELAALYAEKSMAAIAAVYGITHGAVRHRLQMLGLAGVKHSPGPNRRFKPTKEELEALYPRLTMREMATHFGVGETVVYNRLKDHGIVSASRSSRLVGKAKSQEHREAMSRAMTGAVAGEKNPNWRGGSSSKLVIARSRRQYREWKAEVLKRDGYKCTKCGLVHGHICSCCGHRVLLHAHHLRPFKEFPELRYEVSNGVSLCERCHMEEHHSKSGELLETP